MNFENKVVLITGASSGIGAATAILFSSNGANVVLVGRDEIKLDEVAVKCDNFYIIKADISKDEEAKKIVEETINKFGKIDILVNNAGIVKNTSIFNEDITEVYDEIMKINLRAVINVTKAAVPHLIATKGNIVNISSIAGSAITSPALIIYCVSKAGLDQLTRAMAIELASHGVRVNIISPGPVRTDILKNAGVTTSWENIGEAETLLKRVSEPEEIAELVLFLASDKAKGITGSNLINDNGAILKK